VDPFIMVPNSVSFTIDGSARKIKNNSCIFFQAPNHDHKSQMQFLSYTFCHFEFSMRLSSCNLASHILFKNRQTGLTWNNLVLDNKNNNLTEWVFVNMMGGRDKHRDKYFCNTLFFLMQESRAYQESSFEGKTSWGFRIISPWEKGTRTWNGESTHCNGK